MTKQHLSSIIFDIVVQVSRRISFGILLFLYAKFEWVLVVCKNSKYRIPLKLVFTIITKNRTLSLVSKTLTNVVWFDSARVVSYRGGMGNAMDASYDSSSELSCKVRFLVGSI